MDKKIFYQINNLLEKFHKVFLLRLLFLMLIGMFLEIAGIGILLPILNFLVDPSSINESLMEIFNLFNLTKPSEIVIFSLIGVIILYFFKTAFMIYLNWCQNYFAASVSKVTSDKMYTGYLNLNYAFHLHKNSSLLVRNLNIEIPQFTSLIFSFLVAVTESLAILGVVLLLFFIEPLGTVLTSLVIITFFTIFYKLNKNNLVKWGNERQKFSGLMNKDILEGFGGIKEVIFNAKQSFFSNKFSKNNKLYYDFQVKYNTLNATPKYFLELISIVGLSSLIFVMISNSNELIKMIPIIGIFVTAAFRAIPSLNRIIMSIQQLKYASVTVNLISDELELIKSNSVEIRNTKNDKLNFNKIILKNISFTYPKTSEKVLKNISFEILNGQTIGIVGKSGSGKSTLVDILLGIYSIESGSLKIDDIEIGLLNNNWKNSIGYIPQTIYLLDDSIKNNIAFGIKESEIDYDLLKKAINDSQLNELIQELEKGIDTEIGERGVRLSGGQRQRIGIARALYKNPSILFLDEATSSLDSKTEIEVMESINLLKGKITIVIVAHRISTVENCDIIIEMSNGEILNNGSPSKILNL
tara:strand:- start:267 stop:2015 length:1749 start_codon:yes stop_codon:yes gene_type:complete